MSQVTAQADALRGFNRFYTSAIGVITDRYLGQARPLGEARLLFEIGARGASVRDLRTTLDLDAGYLSRLLRSLQGQGLVQVRSRPCDSRARVAELTPAGRVELAGLNERATAVASGLLAPLSDQQRHELITALGIVERRLRLAAIRIEVADPRSPPSRQCLAAYAEEIDQRFPGGFDRAALVPPAEVSGASGAFLVARERRRPVGCGVVRTMEPGIGEIRHIWVHAEARRLGLGRRLLRELEVQARARDLRVVRLDTHEVLAEAISMYRASGYREIPPYDANPYAHHWFEKTLPDPDSSPGSTAHAAGGTQIS
jgi:DNA-binding MarR family transcriptional regulator/ribosomal protein S18 acetylase RimI-like enzyme